MITLFTLKPTRIDRFIFLGRKRWTLRPPPECYFTCQDVELVVEPGEIIVLDTNIWYHKTYVVSEDEISITIGSEFD